MSCSLRIFDWDEFVDSPSSTIKGTFDDVDAFVGVFGSSRDAPAWDQPAVNVVISNDKDATNMQVHTVYYEGRVATIVGYAVPGCFYGLPLPLKVTVTREGGNR
jgi:hypothetical protein